MDLSYGDLGRSLGLSMGHSAAFGEVRAHASGVASRLTHHIGNRSDLCCTKGHIADSLVLHRLQSTIQPTALTSW